MTSIFETNDRALQAAADAREEELRRIQEHPDQSSVTVQIPARLAARLDAHLEWWKANSPEWTDRSRDELVAFMVQHRLLTSVAMDALHTCQGLLKAQAA